MLAANSGQLLVLSFGGVDLLMGRRCVTNELGAGGMGARPTKDGLDSPDTDVTDRTNIPGETFELDHLLGIIKDRLWDGFGGTGQYHSGLGAGKAFDVVHSEVIIAHRGERFFSSRGDRLTAGQPSGVAHP
jgi:N-methylhydantoinase B